VFCFLWERACPRWRPDSRPISCRRTHSLWEPGLPAMAACQPTSHLQMYPFSVGAGLARDGGLPADQSLAGVLIPCGSRACPRWRPASQPISCRRTHSLWEPGLPAMAACQPTNLLPAYSFPVGAGLARDGGLTANLSLTGVHQLIVPTLSAGMPPGALRVPFLCVERCVRNAVLSHAFFRLPGRKPCL
jgi:hypothetical protein